MSNTLNVSMQSYAAMSHAATSTSESHATTSGALDLLKANNVLAPATVVDLSDLAKNLLRQSKPASSTVEKSTDYYSTNKNNPLAQSNNPPPRYASSLTPISFFDSLMPQDSKDSKSDIKWQAGAPYGDSIKSDALFIRDLGLSSHTMDAAGWPPEVGQALEKAIRTGTIKVQKASEVEGLNFKSSHVFTPNKNDGSGYDTMGGTSQNPIGDVKKTIEAGRGLALWTADRGDVYLTW